MNYDLLTPALRTEFLKAFEQTVASSNASFGELIDREKITGGCVRAEHANQVCWHEDDMLHQDHPGFLLIQARQLGKAWGTLDEKIIFNLMGYQVFGDLLPPGVKVMRHAQVVAHPAESISRMVVLALSKFGCLETGLKLHVLHHPSMYHDWTQVPGLFHRYIHDGIYSPIRVVLVSTQRVSDPKTWVIVATGPNLQRPFSIVPRRDTSMREWVSRDTGFHHFEARQRCRLKLNRKSCIVKFRLAETEVKP